MDDSPEVDVNGNGPRRPSVTMGIEHLLSVCKVKKSLKRKRTCGKRMLDSNCNGNYDSPSSEFATLEMELRYSVSTQVSGCFSVPPLLLANLILDLYKAIESQI